jgi:hypothetical protein
MKIDGTWMSADYADGNGWGHANPLIHLARIVGAIGAP